MSRRRAVLGALTTLALFTVMGLIAGCVAPAPPTGPPPVADPTVVYHVIGGVEQIYVIGAHEGDPIEVAANGMTVGSGTADRLGSWVLRGLTQGQTYTVTDHASGDQRDVRVLVADEHPPESFYRSISMHEGLNYVPTRDGTTLAATVRPPLGATLGEGPFPTVIEYSGYQIAAPNEPLVSKLKSLFDLPTDPLAPASSTDVGSLLMRLAGFAVVSLQLRGSGCSGGEADLFDLPSRLDGYDLVETVAAQPWVSHGMVGMVGISFSGFSQIATASTRPPHLAAIAPLSFVGSFYDLAHPGGVFNNGFASTWMKERMENARPAPDPGALSYANALVGTDGNCRQNQLVRLQTLDGNGLLRSESTFSEVYRRRDFREEMKLIQVPTFASLQFDDEETSGYAILSSSDLLGANDKVWLNVSNGHHRDAVTPDTITQLFEFLDIYVARRTPRIKVWVDLLSSLVFGDGSAKPPLPARFFGSYESAKAEFESRPRVRVLLELTSGQNEGSNPGARWQFNAPSFPVTGSTERTWFLGAGGDLGASPGSGGTADYHPDPSVRPEAIDPHALLTEGEETEDAPLVWTEVPAGNGVAFVTPPLDRDIVALGPAAATLRISSSAADTDLGLVVSEVRPDGQEMLVSTGVQRASMREVDPTRSTPTRPAFLNVDPKPLDPGVTEVPVQILPIGHVFRAGSRIRLSINSPADRERWAYETIDPSGGATLNSVHFGGAQPSSLTFTVIDRTGYPADLLPCPAPGKKCRDYVPASNGG